MGFPFVEVMVAHADVIVPGMVQLRYQVQPHRHLVTPVVVPHLRLERCNKMQLYNHICRKINFINQNYQLFCAQFRNIALPSNQPHETNQTKPGAGAPLAEHPRAPHKNPITRKIRRTRLKTDIPLKTFGALLTF